MQNVEIKARLRDRAAAERRLDAMGAQLIWRKKQRDTFFDVTRGWLKLRETEDSRPELISYDRPTSHSGPRTSRYDVLPVKDAEAWTRLLGRVLDVGAVVEKERTLWLYEHTRIHLDEVTGLGSYIELETIVMDISLDEAREETNRVIYALALDDADFVSVPYRVLLAEAGES